MAKPLIEELCDYLVTRGLGTLRTTLFISHLPENSFAPVAALRNVGGPAPTGFNPISDTLVQVMVRGAPNDFEGANQHAAKIYNVFHRMVGVDLTNNRVRSCVAQQEPADLGPDKEKRSYISCNYEFNTHAITDSGEASSEFGGDATPDLN